MICAACAFFVQVDVLSYAQRVIETASAQARLFGAPVAQRITELASQATESLLRIRALVESQVTTQVTTQVII